MFLLKLQHESTLLQKFYLPELLNVIISALYLKSYCIY